MYCRYSFKDLNNLATC